MIEGSSVISRNPRVEFRTLGEGEGGVLLHLDTAAYHGLNEIGVLIWSLIDDIRFEDLVQELRGRLEKAPESLTDDISEFLTELAERDLVRYGQNEA